MTYKLFLDDYRYPLQSDWIIARNMDDAVWYIKHKGIPYFISFDHDLAEDHYKNGDGEKTGYTFAKWLCDYITANDIILPANFDFYVHSMNPVGAENIRQYMRNFLKNYKN